MSIAGRAGETHGGGRMATTAEAARGMVHTWDMWPSIPMCGHSAPGDAITHAAFRCLPVEAQCPRCLRLMSACYRGRQSASPADILSVSLLCGGLHGSPLDARLGLLLAAHLTDPDALPVLLDHAETLGLDAVPVTREDGTIGGPWERVEVEWPEVDEHGTGNNPHVWLPRAREMRYGDETITIKHGVCPCGTTWAKWASEGDFRPGTLDPLAVEGEAALVEAMRRQHAQETR